MRRFIIPVLLFMLTGPNGAHLWIAGDGIEVVRASDECQKPARTQVWASTGMFCVQETVDDVLAKIKEDLKEEEK